MTNSRNIKLKALMAKWLLISTLVVSLFAVSGPVGQSIFQSQKSRTELVFSNNAKPGYRAIAYQIRREHARPQFIYNASLLHSCHLLAYGRLSKVKLDQLLRQADGLQICRRSHHLKIIPQNPGEDPADCFIA
ncbi:hypothetical protein SAMN05216490_4275 [Mucilaginibacter mallensis]|uniref:Uncharacterized protein n=1 Tax=Mucilaginibacter mallensis TaxID=652787 RepID=A0A1H2BQH4_MUCMA|nr:hypothetical protein [Mucilaginibacter mallensis]SDT60458.1 hypothetical protein SAMN05216490_4275 [Mucilaginibacter mallensis]